MQTIPLTAAKLAPFTPESLKSDDPAKKDPVFRMRIPTMVERDELPSRLLHLGLHQVTNSILRATLIDDLYNHFDEETADDNANFLDSMWQRQEVMEEARLRWQEQEVERILDIRAGAPEIEPVPFPEQIIKPREAARAELLIDKMTKESTRVRDLIEQQLKYNSNNKMLLARLHVAAVENLPGLSRPLETEDNCLTLEAGTALREAVDDRAWNELMLYIDEMYGVDSSEEKNSDLQPGKLPDRTGSTLQSDEQESSDGSSTTSNTEPAPDGVSPPTTGSSSHFTSAPGGQTASPGLTDVL